MNDPYREHRPAPARNLPKAAPAAPAWRIVKAWLSGTLARLQRRRQRQAIRRNPEWAILQASSATALFEVARALAYPRRADRSLDPLFHEHLFELASRWRVLGRRKWRFERGYAKATIGISFLIDSTIPGSTTLRFVDFAERMRDAGVSVAQIDALKMKRSKHGLKLRRYP